MAYDQLKPYNFPPQVLSTTHSNKSADAANTTTIATTPTLEKDPKRQCQMTVKASGVGTHKIPLLNSSIAQGHWLNDEHLDHAQFLLSAVDPSVHGFLSVLMIPRSRQSMSEPLQNPFIQILNYAGNHWICLSTVGCQANQICIYDSLYTGQTDKLLEQQVKLLMYLYVYY